MFQYLLPNIQGPVNDGDLSSALETFNQVEFFDFHGYSSMSETGYYYIPDACNGNGNSCHLHVFFHGCAMSTDNIGTEFLENSGLLEMAEANQIVMLFPQIKNNMFFGNPHGCWNTLAYLGDLDGGAFATKNAVQMHGIKKMIERMTGGAV
jgi:predicted peptidase